jgi:gliding motility-associated-like protein
VIEYPVPQLSFAAFPLSGCDPLDVSTINTSSLNGSVIQSWQWQVGTESSNDTAPSFTLSPEGFYNVFVQATTDKGCIVDSTVSNYIEVFPTPDPVIVPLAMEYELTDDNIEILNQSTQATMYEWSVFNMLISTQQDLIYPVTDTGHFDFQLLAMNQYGCKDSTNVIITVNPSFAIYFPNAFSPNENGNNDIYLPSGYGIDEFDLMIFDRWGEMVFHSTDFTKGWDGTYKGNKPFKDVYVYKCRIRDIKGDPHYYFGHITLIQ